MNYDPIFQMMQYSTWTDLARGNGGNDPKDAFILSKIAAMRTRSAIMALFGLNSFCLLGRANDTLCNSMRPPGPPHGKDPQEHFLLDNNFQYRVGQIVLWSLLVVFVPRLSICWLWGPWHTQPVSSSPGSCALKETSSVVNRAKKCTRTDFDYAQICKFFRKDISQCTEQNTFSVKSFHSPMFYLTLRKGLPGTGSCQQAMEELTRLCPPSPATHNSRCTQYSPNLHSSNWHTPLYGRNTITMKNISSNFITDMQKA